jgi:Tfp pilus assembly protein PilN
MIQFNLLPGVKQEYIQARRTKQLVVLISFAVSAASLAILLLLLVTVDVVQKKSLSDANTDIKKYSAQLKAVPDLDKILTVQNQLNTLTSLHDQKPVVSRTFTYLSEVTPGTVSISSYTADHAANTMTITGEAQSLDQVNVYADTLKATTFTTDSDTTTKQAFPSVVLSAFGRDSKGATYTLKIIFDPKIFSKQYDVKLAVPSIVTSAQQQLFQKQAGD